MDKDKIKEEIFYHHLRDLKNKMKNFEKLDDISNDDIRKAQLYMKDFCLETCTMAFQLRTHQFRCRVNMTRLFGGVLWCHSCSSGPEVAGRPPWSPSPT